MSLARAPRLAHHTLFNFLGQVIPFLAGLVAIPLLIRGLGTERFGVLTLAWIVVGYFSIFDLGLGRALTQVVAERTSGAAAAQAPSVTWPALGAMLLLGIAGGALLALFAPWLTRSVLRIPDGLEQETVSALWILAAAVPFVVVTAGLTGILTAFHRFGVINAIRVPMGLWSFVAPLAVLPWTTSLVWVAVVLAAGRLLACAAYAWACAGVMPPFGGTFREVRPLFRFGAWMTVSTTLSPIMQYLDRFVIGAMISMAAVAYYVTPYEAVTRILVVPGALLGVLFPVFAASHREDRSRLIRVYLQGTKYIALVLFPAMLLIGAFAHEGLTLWLGKEFGAQGGAVLQVLVLGVFANGVAQVFATLLQGMGRPDLSAKLHLVELPLYLASLWAGIHFFGILGAAVAWTARMVADGAVLFWITHRVLEDDGAIARKLGLGLVAALSALAVPLLITGLGTRIGAVLALLAGYTLLAWSAVLDDGERSVLRGLLHLPAPSGG
jgi:O-antigen/teichoic acid export membrane protein